MSEHLDVELLLDVLVFKINTSHQPNTDIQQADRVVKGISTK